MDARGSGTAPRRCPCGSGAGYDRCCGPLHGGTPAGTAEALMRSRYSAYALGDARHILSTWHPTTRPASIHLPGDLRWTGLEVLDVVGGGRFDDEGVVEFRAHHEEGGERGAMWERSRFQRWERRWTYVGAEGIDRLA